MAAKTIYECRNPACTLGGVNGPGRFTGGMTAEAKHLLTGAPLESFTKGADYGPGFCPNCGVLAAEYDPADAAKDAIADATAAHKAHIAAIKEGVA